MTTSHYHPDNKIEYCHAIGTTRGEDHGDGKPGADILHHCRYPADHPITTPHSCWLCGTTWHDEASC